MITTKGDKRYLITPGNPLKFIKLLRRRVKYAEKGG